MKLNFLNTTKSVLFVSALAFITTGCLKQYDSSAKDYNNDNPSTLLEFVKKDDNHLGIVSSPSAISLEGQPAVETVVLGYLRVASPDLPTSAMNVTLKVDTSAAVLPSGTIALPAAAYTLNTAFTTATGVRNNNIQIQLTKAALDPTKTYAIGITVSNPGSAKLNPLGNMLVVQISVKNKYDGVYKMNLRLDNWDAYGISSGIAADFPTNISLVTAGTNSVTLLQTNGSNLQPAYTGGTGSITGTTQFGAASPKYFFDANDKVSSVVNTTADDGRGRAFYLDPTSTTSLWTASTKGIKVEYYMKQNGRPDMKITAIYTYVRAR